jgi:hypothetical protein
VRKEGDFPSLRQSDVGSRGQFAEPEIDVFWFCSFGIGSGLSRGRGGGVGNGLGI